MLSRLFGKKKPKKEEPKAKKKTDKLLDLNALMIAIKNG